MEKENRLERGLEERARRVSYFSEHRPLEGILYAYSTVTETTLRSGNECLRDGDLPEESSAKILYLTLLSIAEKRAGYCGREFTEKAASRRPASARNVSLGPLPPDAVSAFSCLLKEVPGVYSVAIPERKAGAFIVVSAHARVAEIIVEELQNIKIKRPRGAEGSVLERLEAVHGGEHKSARLVYLQENVPFLLPESLSGGILVSRTESTVLRMTSAYYWKAADERTLRAMRVAVEAEGQRHGELEEVTVPCDVQGSIYIKCTSLAHARAVFRGLSGRTFAGRSFLLSYFPESHYLSGLLS